MPTSAATGTKSVRTASRPKVTDDTRTDSEREADENAAQARRDIAASKAAPLADPCGNGTVQAVASDGRVVNVDASHDGWEDEVRAADPKHPVLRG